MQLKFDGASRRLGVEDRAPICEQALDHRNPAGSNLFLLPEQAGNQEQRIAGLVDLLSRRRHPGTEACWVVGPCVPNQPLYPGRQPPAVSRRMELRGPQDERRIAIWVDAGREHRVERPMREEDPEPKR